MPPTHRLAHRLALTAAILIAVVTAAAGLVAAPAGAAPAPEYVPGKVLVGYRTSTPAVAAQARALTARIVSRSGVRATAAGAAGAPSSGEQLLQLPQGLSVPAAVSALRAQPGVAYAVPDYIAHQAGSWIPDDPGRSNHPGGWEAMQWNFLPGVGVNAPEAWANLRADHRPGATGVTVAILDSGVAYRNWRGFTKSPDFNHTRFVKPYDFVARNALPLDRDGHGTFVAGLVAESTNNGFGLTGLAYGASIMPVRVLGSDGSGDAAAISKGIRYAATHGAQVINLSLEFPLGVTPSDIPDIVSAIHFAHSRGVVVVAAAGNEGSDEVAYPARTPDAISVGATTKDRCLANYSNTGGHLDLVAPGGGNDSSVLTDPNCHWNRTLPQISQMSFLNPSNPRHFGYPALIGTSMATPEVAAAAALLIASGVIGRHPGPAQVLARLEATAQPLGGARPNSNYGYGLLDAGAATRG